MRACWFDLYASQCCDGWRWPELLDKLVGSFRTMFQAVLGEVPGVFASSLVGPLAQMRNWQRMGDGIHRRGSRLEMIDLLPYFIGLVLIGLAIWAAIAWKKRNDQSIPCDDPPKLFRELCQLHGIKGSNRRLLKQLAEAWNLEQPAEIFIAPQAFEFAKLPENVQSTFDEQQLHDLRARLFK